MSLLPFLGLVFTLLDLIGRADEGAGIVDMMFRFMPSEAALTLQEPVVQVVGTASGVVLTLSLVVCSGSQRRAAKASGRCSTEATGRGRPEAIGGVGRTVRYW